METPAPSLERVQEVRLLALLHDLVRQEGRTGAAAVLGVHRKTVAAAVNTGRLSRRMHDALGRHLLERAASDAPTGQAEDQQLPVGRSTRQRHCSANWSNGWRPSVCRAYNGEDVAAQRTQALEHRLAALEAPRQDGGGMATVPGATTGSQSSAPVVSDAPCTAGSGALYGAAAPLIIAVAAGTGGARRGGRPPDRRAHGGAAAGVGVGPDRNAYRLTLPPAPAPWDALTRRHEVDWRQRTLARVRGERRRAASRHAACAGCSRWAWW